MNVLIVGEDAVLARRVERLCRGLFGVQLEVARIAAGFGGAGAWADEALVDLLVLDLNLHGPDAMELLARGVAGSFQTIVMSSSIELALRAFEFGVLDFVPKPVVTERVVQALERAVDVHARAGVAARFLAVKRAGQVALLPVAEVIYVHGLGFTSELFLSGGRHEPHDKSLERLEAILPPDFERLHRNFLVRSSAVKQLHAGADGSIEAELANGVRLPVDAGYTGEISDKLYRLACV